MTEEFNLSEKNPILNFISKEIAKRKKKKESIDSIILIDDIYRKLLKETDFYKFCNNIKPSTIMGIRFFVFPKYSTFSFGDDNILISEAELAGDKLNIYRSVEGENRMMKDKIAQIKEEIEKLELQTPNEIVNTSKYHWTEQNWIKLHLLQAELKGILIARDEIIKMIDEILEPYDEDGFIDTTIFRNELKEKLK